MPPISAALDEMIRIGRLLYSRKYVVAAEGNMSQALGGDLFLVTPAGACKGELRATDLLVVDAEGTPQTDRTIPQVTTPDSAAISSDNPDFRHRQPALRASSEWPLHREIYRRRPDIKAICHAHPPWATAFAAAGQPLAGCLLPEIIAVFGQVPLAPYGTPGTEAVPASVRELVATHDALLLANHGVVTLGLTLTEAYHRLESVEHLAQVTLLSRLAGGESRLSSEEAATVQALSANRFPEGATLGCEPAPPDLTAGSAEAGGDAGGSDMASRVADLEPLIGKLVREILRELDTW